MDFEYQALLTWIDDKIVERQRFVDEMFEVNGPDPETWFPAAQQSLDFWANEEKRFIQVRNILEKAKHLAVAID